MKRLFGVMLVLATAAIPAAGQLNRSFVSVNGSDSNPCTPSQPCRSFGAALAVTNSGGETIALDSGGYGQFTVDRSVTVIAPPGIHAGVVATSSDAIFIDAGAGGKVILRGLALEGLGLGNRGIAFGASGQTLHVEDCTIDDFGNGSGIFVGLPAPAMLSVRNTVIRKPNLAGIWMQAGAPSHAVLDRVTVQGAGYGILVADNVTAVVRNSIASGNVDGFHAEGGKMTLENCLADRNQNGGVLAIGLGGLARISNCVITGNGLGIAGTIHSWNNNKISGNGTNVQNPPTILTAQ